MQKNPERINAVVEQLVDQKRRQHHTIDAEAAAGDHLLKDKRFLTARRGVIVNMAYIQRFDDVLLYLTVGDPIPISVRNRKKLEQIWDNYLVDRMRSDILKGGML